MSDELGCNPLRWQKDTGYILPDFIILVFSDPKIYKMHILKSRLLLNLVPCQQGEDSEGDEWLGDRKARLPVVEVGCEIIWV